MTFFHPDDREPTIKPFALAAALPLLLSFNALWAQDEEASFKAVDIRGEVTIYRDETGETARFHATQSAEEGDRLSTGPGSDVVLRLKDRAYVYLPPNTRVRLTRLHMGEKGLQCRINLLSGRLTAQFDRTPDWDFEVSTDNLRCRAHGTLLEVFRQKQTVYLTSFEGAVVATNTKGQVQMAKSKQVVKFEAGKFRYRHYLRNDQEERLAQWQERLQKVLSRQIPPKP
jgi:ferric-dicitrate binding protein FerR (iron transport regulator)